MQSQLEGWVDQLNDIAASASPPVRDIINGYTWREAKTLADLRDDLADMINEIDGSPLTRGSLQLLYGEVNRAAQDEENNQ